MSPYSSDVDKRLNVYIIMWIISALIAFAINYFVNILLKESELFVQFIVFIVSLSPMAVCMLFTDRLPQSFLLNVSGIVDLSGKYEGILKTSHDSFSEEHSVIVTIKQTMGSMDISLSTQDSKSHNTSASINTANGMVALLYTYCNEGSTEKSLNMHDGTCELIFDNDTVSGNYYTSHDRKNYGSIKMQRIN